MRNFIGLLVVAAFADALFPSDAGQCSATARSFVVFALKTVVIL